MTKRIKPPLPPPPALSMARRAWLAGAGGWLLAGAAHPAGAGDGQTSAHTGAGTPPRPAPGVPASTARAPAPATPPGDAADAAPPPPGEPLPARALRFPRDHGSHPAWRTEWWYITGRALGSGGAAREFGFQLTFFRSRVDATQTMRSALAARQLLFAHAAVTDLAGARLWHDQRLLRASGHPGLDRGHAATADLDLALRDAARGDWSLRRVAASGTGGEHLLARLPAADFALDLRFDPTQPLLLQGQDGRSRKGPGAGHASYYSSWPQLAVSGQLALRGQRHAVRGRAWFDHEWSEALMAPEAVGWDWCGINTDDGGALTAFRLRRADGSAVWAGGSWRSADGALRVFAADQVQWRALAHWQSPASGVRYPVAWQLETPLGRFSLRARLPNQELDSRASTGALYWEGLSELLDAHGQRIGHGYLEMTGYASALRLS